MRIFIATIVILLRNINDSCCTYCGFTIDANRVNAELRLDNTPSSICDIILKNCPKNMTTISITSDSTNWKHSFSLDCLNRSVLPKIESVSMKLSNLDVSAKFNRNLSSNLRELFLSDCGITALPQFGMFYGFDKLETIDLSRNLLQEIPQDLLMYSPLVKKLDISSNRIVLLPFLLNASSAYIDVSNNPLSCSCTNVWVMSQIPFNGYNCIENIPSCEPSIVLSAYADEPVNMQNDSFQVSASPGASVLLGCHISSSISLDMFWVTPVGIIPAINSSHTYTVQPIIAETSLTVTRSDSNIDVLITNARGHLSGIWYCIGRSPVKVTVSSAIALHIYSGLYQESIYFTSLYYGFSAMVVLLLVGIIGGTIRYCSETHCLRRPQPPFAYGGKTFIGVIPVPEDDGKNKQKRSENKETSENCNSLQFHITEHRCSLCNNPPTYWFCHPCKTTHYMEVAFERLDHPDIAPESVQCGLLSQHGEIKILGTNADMTSESNNPLTVTVHIPNTGVEVRSLITMQTLSDNNETTDIIDPLQERESDANVSVLDIYVRSGKCIVRLCQMTDNADVFSIMSKLCFHYSLRRKGADVKLVVSNEKLAEEYRQALDGLARAVESSDPAHFRDRLEDFRSRLRRDVGHGVKVLRGEFQDLRAKSARGVASLKNQSSAAAQRMRAGLSYSMEQMKDSMRSVAELCGVSGTVGQTISVVSIYKDENDNTLKERLVSDFVF